MRKWFLSSVGRATDWKSVCPWFDSWRNHFKALLSQDKKGFSFSWQTYNFIMYVLWVIIGIKYVLEPSNKQCFINFYDKNHCREWIIILLLKQKFFMVKFYPLFLYIFVALFIGILIGIHVQQGRHEVAHNKNEVFHIENRQLNSQLIIDTATVTLDVKKKWVKFHHKKLLL